MIHSLESLHVSVAHRTGDLLVGDDSINPLQQMLSSKIDGRTDRQRDGQIDR